MVASTTAAVASRPSNAVVVTDEFDGATLAPRGNLLGCDPTRAAEVGIAGSHEPVILPVRITLQHDAGAVAKAGELERSADHQSARSRA
jgi:hypothetical protein